MTVRELIGQAYGSVYLGMQPVPAAGPVSQDAEILKAYLGWLPEKPFFGQMLAVIRCGSRYFALHYHIWRPHQKPAEANRLIGIQELAAKQTAGGDCLVRRDTDFGLQAFRLYTPDSSLDEQSLMLRAVAKKLKEYSVRNQLCRKFRAAYKNT